jgi:hypothetical protein
MRCSNCNMRSTWAIDIIAHTVSGLCGDCLYESPAVQARLHKLRRHHLHGKLADVLCDVFHQPLTVKQWAMIHDARWCLRYVETLTARSTGSRVLAIRELLKYAEQQDAVWRFNMAMTNRDIHAP